MGVNVTEEVLFFRSEHRHPLTTKTLETRSRYQSTKLQTCNRVLVLCFAFPVRPGSRIKGGCGERDEGSMGGLTWKELSPMSGPKMRIPLD